MKRLLSILIVYGYHFKEIPKPILPGFLNFMAYYLNNATQCLSNKGF